MACVMYAIAAIVGFFSYILACTYTFMEKANCTSLKLNWLQDADIMNGGLSISILWNIQVILLVL